MESTVVDVHCLAMTTRDIADLTGKNHADVLRDTRSMFEQLQIGESNFAGTYISGQNKQMPLFNLPKALSLTLVSGYNVVMRKRIIDRWIELEDSGRPAFKVPTSLSGALRLAAEQAETIEFQERQIAAARPAVEFVERYVESSGNKGFRQVCKLLGVSEPEFREFLISSKIMYRLAGELTPFAEHQGTGRFVVKAGTSETQHAYNQALFTPKGVNWVAGEWAKYRLAKRAESMALHNIEG